MRIRGGILALPATLAIGCARHDDGAQENQARSDTRIEACAAVPAAWSSEDSPAHVFRPDTRPASVRYIPIGIWRDAGQAGFMERWYGGQLAAMCEPILSRPGDRREFRRRFRMLVLPSFGPAYAIRVDQLADRRGQVRIVRLSGSGGHGPGRVEQMERFTMTAQQMSAGWRGIEAAGLAHLPARGSGGGTDGVGFVFELIDDEGYHFIDRHQGDLSPILEALVWQVDGLRRTVESSLHFYRSRETGSLRPSGSPQ